MQQTTKKDQTPNKDVQQFTDKAKDVAHTAAETTRDAASHAGQAISGAATNAGRKAEEWTAAAGERVESLADTVRDRGPSSGMLGSANRAVADTLEATGEYLHDKNLSGMMDDMTNLIKRNPIPALVFGLGVGFLLGRALRS